MVPAMHPKNIYLSVKKHQICSQILPVFAQKTICENTHDTVYSMETPRENRRAERHENGLVPGKISSEPYNFSATIVVAMG